MKTIEIPWPASGSGGISQTQFTMVPDEIYACHFHTPADLGPKSGSIGLHEFNGQPCARVGCLSLVPGALNAPIAGDGTAFQGSVAPTVSFMGSPDHHKALLVPNTDYYFNVKLDNPPSIGVFGSQIDFQKPRS